MCSENVRHVRDSQVEIRDFDSPHEARGACHRFFFFFFLSPLLQLSYPTEPGVPV